MDRGLKLTLPNFLLAEREFAGGFFHASKDLLVAIIYSVIGKELKWILSINKILT